MRKKDVRKLSEILDELLDLIMPGPGRYFSGVYGDTLDDVRLRLQERISEYYKHELEKGNKEEK